MKKTNKVIINSPFELEGELCRYNCHTAEELADTLWLDYDAVLTILF